MKKEIIQFNFKMIISVGFLIFCLSVSLNAGEDFKEFSITEIEETVQLLMEKGDIPGLSLVILRPDHPDFIKSFGYADLEKNTQVTPDTLFELGSCSKSFTALAALQLEKEGRLNLDFPVSMYLPWFYVRYKKEKTGITLRQLLHQTSGIPFRSIKMIPRSDEKDALEQTVKNIVGLELDYMPGSQFLYATVNYDIIGLIIEKVSGLSYEDYMVTHVFKPLGLSATRVGGVCMAGESPAVAGKMAAGYKISFWAPRRYNAPPYRGNNPSGYIISNAKDMERWLKLQMGVVESPVTPLIQKSHQWDRTVPPLPFDMSAYAMGWMVSLRGDGIISHVGGNPNFTAYVAFKPKEKVGVAIMANSNSSYTPFIGETVMKLLYGIALDEDAAPGKTIDSVTSVISIILGFCFLIVLAYVATVVIDLFKGRRQRESLTWKKTAKILAVFPISAPFLFGIYLIPMALSNLPWEVALVWTSLSFTVAIILLLVISAATYLAYILSVIFPKKNKYPKSTSMLVMLSIISGFANAVILFLIATSLFSSIKLVYQVYYFGLAMGLYILGLKMVQTKLGKVTFDIFFDKRMKWIEKSVSNAQGKFGGSDRGAVLSVLNNYTCHAENPANFYVMLLTAIVKVFAVLLYLSIISFWAAVGTLGGIIVIAALYYIMVQKLQVYFEKSRDAWDMYLLRLLNGLLGKKKEYADDDIEKYTDEFRSNTIPANVKFINVFIICEMVLVAFLGAICFAVPMLFPQITTFTLMCFIMAFLYLIGPINSLLGAIPNIMQLKMTWNHVKELMSSIDK